VRALDAIRVGCAVGVSPIGAFVDHGERPRAAAIPAGLPAVAPGR